MDEPKLTRPFCIDDLPWEEWQEKETFGSRFKRLGAHGGATRIGVTLEELPPGMQSVPFHYHLFEEEQLYALKGSATLRLGEERYPIKAGDYVVFPAGQEAGHCLINEGDAPFTFLMIGERNPAEVCVYPDSRKVLVRATHGIHMQDATVDYWEGESGPQPRPKA